MADGKTERLQLPPSFEELADAATNFRRKNEAAERLAL
jgi:hypothetical protein